MTVIEAQDLHKRYEERVAVRDVSYAVEEGEIFGILGPNGAGRTTTVEMIEGLRDRDGGSISVLGRDPANDPTLREQVCGRVALSDAAIADLPQVTDVRRDGDEVVVTGTADALAAVTALLARRDVFPERLRVEQATLEDAFVALTGRPAQTDPEEVAA